MVRRAAQGVIGAGLGLVLALLSAGGGPAGGPAAAAVKAGSAHGTFARDGSVGPHLVDRGAPVAAGRTGPAQARASRPRLPLLEVRVAEHAGFSRLVFDWTWAVGYRVVKKGGRAIIRFNRGAWIDLQGLRASLPMYVTGIGASAGAEGLVVGLAVHEAARLRHFRIGTRVVVDVLKPAIAATRTAKPARPAKAFEVAPAPAVKSTAKEEKPASEPASEPAPETRAERKRAQSLESAGKTQSPEAAEPTNLIGPRLEGRINGGPVAVEWGKVRNVTRLSFAWREKVGAAVFTRAGFLWVVFDREASLDFNGLGRGRREGVGTFEQRPLAGATVVRFELTSGANPVVRRDGTAWVVELVNAESRPSSDIPVESRMEAPKGPRLFLSVADAGNAVEIRDPEVGDKFWAVPVAAAGRGVAVARVFAELQILATAQGVAISPLADGVKIRTLPNGVELTTAGGLRLSGGGPSPGQKAEQRNGAEYGGKAPAALSRTVLP